MLMLVVAIAGCVCFSGTPSEKRPGENTVGPISVPPAPASAPQGSAYPTAAASLDPFDLSAARWVEYRMTGTNNGQPYSYTEKLEYGASTSGGAQTQNIKKTITSNDASSVNTLGDGKLFNYHTSSTQSSTSSGSLVPFDRIKNDDPILSAERVGGAPVGSESVTVPKGTYDCKKYLGSFRGADATYWEAPGVPVPVKVYTASDGTTLELVDWG